MEYWRSRRDGHAIPAYGDLPVRELKPWLGHLALIDPMKNGDFRIRLGGTELIPRFGRESTGLTIRELDRSIREGLLSVLRRACVKKQPVITALTTRFQGRRTLHSEVVLPFRTADMHVGMLVLGSYSISGD
jgi:hypothetical protein